VSNKIGISVRLLLLPLLDLAAPISVCPFLFSLPRSHVRRCTQLHTASHSFTQLRYRSPSRRCESGFNSPQVKFVKVCLTIYKASLGPRILMKRMKSQAPTKSMQVHSPRRLSVVYNAEVLAQRSSCLVSNVGYPSIC
jgi:hypothetical protein